MPKVTKKSAPASERKVLFPELQVSLATGKNAITAEKAKEILGWEEVDAKDDGCVSELSALTGKKIRLLNNDKNRYLTPGWLLTLKQEHLNKRWRFNGESIVRGKTGRMLSGQHRLISLILAELERSEGENGSHWKELWPEPITMDCLVVSGVDESDDTFKTLNCGKPGTFAEFLFRHELLAKYKAGDRKDIAKIVDFAVRLLWERTGEKLDAFHPRRTHAEAENFILRHPKLLKCVKHVYDENQRSKDDDGKMSPPPIGMYLSPGYASAMCYLMATSASDKAKYDDGDRNEKGCSFANAEKADRFWIELAEGVRGNLKHVANAIGALNDPDTGALGKLSEKLAVICLAWAVYKDGKHPTEKQLDMSEFYQENEDGIREFHGSHLTLGGIDSAVKPKSLEDPEEGNDGDGEEAEAPTMTAEQKKAKREADKAKLLAMRNAKPAGSDAPNPSTELDKWTSLRVEHKLGDGDVMIEKARTGVITAYAGDADVVTAAARLSFIKEQGNKRVTIMAKDLQLVAEMVAAKGHRVIFVEHVAAGGIKGGSTSKMSVLVEAKKQPVVKGK